jgi:hypothetical protein
MSTAHGYVFQLHYRHVNGLLLPAIIWWALEHALTVASMSPPPLHITNPSISLPHLGPDTYFIFFFEKQRVLVSGLRVEYHSRDIHADTRSLLAMMLTFCLLTMLYACYTDNGARVLSFLK